jgi:hypothetical protein
MKEMDGQMSLFAWGWAEPILTVGGVEQEVQEQFADEVCDGVNCWCAEPQPDTGDDDQRW